MIKQDQDTIWNSIPPELRNKIKQDFNLISTEPDVGHIAQNQIMIKYFGRHNLESVYNVGDYVYIKGTKVPRKIMGISKNGQYVLNGKGSMYPKDELDPVE